MRKPTKIVLSAWFAVVAMPLVFRGPGEHTFKMLVGSTVIFVPLLIILKIIYWATSSASAAFRRRSE
jgi:hypothetical protein